MKKSEIESLEAELSDAKKAVRELVSKIEESNSRSKQFHRKPKWREEEEEENPETLIKKEDARYAEVMNEVEFIKQELGKLKIDMARVLKEKRRAERASRASSSKRLNLLASMELMKKELQELDEEQAVVDFARIDDVKECESVNEVKKNELQITACDASFGMEKGSQLNVVTVELEGVKQELESVKGEGFRFMTSMDVVREELKRVREETGRLQKAEQKRELTVQNLNSKILRAKEKLESLTSAESRTGMVVSNLIVTLEQLRAEGGRILRDKDVIYEEIENVNVEILKTGNEVDVVEERLEAEMEELKVVKSSESKALGNLRNLINARIEARDAASMNVSVIKITDFEYEYLTGKAGRAAELADKKIGAAQAWVEALKASEREILMKIEMAQNEISELSIEVDPEGDGEAPGLQEMVVATARRSMTKVGTKVSVKRAKLQKFRSPGARYSGKFYAERKK